MQNSNRQEEPRAGAGAIVVGIDGSPPSNAAAHWALRQAQLTDSPVKAMTAWEFPAFYSWEGGPMPPEDFSTAARQALDESLAQALADTGFSGPVERSVVQGHAAQVLLDASNEASLLVVGSRGHGGFVGALLGSVSQRCVAHARCPVVIVRSGDHAH